MLFFIHILFLGLFFLCGYIIYQLIKVGKLIFSGEVIFELFYKEQKGSFELLEEGRYSIWQRGKLRKRTPVDRFHPLIINQDTNEVINLRTSLIRPNTNNGSMGSMELFRFRAPAGKYTLEYAQGSSISFIENIISSTILNNNISNDTLEKYSLQIRKSAHPLHFLLFIILMQLAIITLIGGFLGLAFADQWFG